VVDPSNLFAGNAEAELIGRLALFSRDVTQALICRAEQRPGRDCSTESNTTALGGQAIRILATMVRVEQAKER